MAETPDNKSFATRVSEFRAVEKERKERETQKAPALPSQDVIESVQQKLSAPRGLVQSFKTGQPWGATPLDDQQDYLSKVLKKRGRADTEQSRELLLKGLVDTTISQLPQSRNNFMFSPTEDKIDPDAAKAVKTWAQQAIYKDYKTNEEMYENLGRDYRAFMTKQKQVFAEMGQMEKPTESLTGIYLSDTGPVKIATVPRYDSGMNAKIKDTMNDPILRFMYEETPDNQTLDLISQGLSVGQSRRHVFEALGDERDVDQVMQNAFFMTEAALPGQIFIPFDATKDGRIFRPIERWELSIRNALYDRYLKKEGLKFGEAPPEKVRELRAKAEFKAKDILAPIVSGPGLVAYRDPHREVADFYEGKGFRANTVKALQAIASIGTLGLDEYWLGDIPDKIIRSAGVLTLPRSGAGYLMRGGEHKGFLRPGELFATTLGDAGTTNFLDLLLRLDPMETVAAAHAIAVDEDAAAGGDFKGRPGRVLSRALQVYGTSEHDRKIIQTAELGGRFFTEFGDVYINPWLPGDFGEKHPGFGRVAGILGALSLYVASADALTGTALATAAVTKQSPKLANLLGLEYRQMVQRGGPRVLQAIEVARKEVGDVATLAPGDVVKFDRVFRREINKDTTGAARAYELFAQMMTTSDKGVVAALEGGEALQELTTYYVAAKDRAKSLAKRAQQRLDKAAASKNKSEKLVEELTAAQNILESMKSNVDALETVVGEQTKLLAKREASLNAQSRMFATRMVPGSGIKGAFTPDELEDLLRVKGGQLTLDQFFVKHANSAGTVAGYAKNSLVKPQQLQKAITRNSRSRATAARNIQAARARVQAAKATLKTSTDELDVMRRFIDAGLNPALKNMGKAARLKAIRTKNGPTLTAQIEQRLDDVAAKAEKLNARIEKAKVTIGAREKEIEIAKALKGKALQPFVAKEYQDYLDNLTQLVRGSEALLTLPKANYDGIFQNLGTRMRGEVVRDKKLMAKIRSEVDGTEAAKLSDEGLVDDVFTTRAIVNLFEEPRGIIQRSFRSQLTLVRNPASWIIKATIAVRRLISESELFKTNTRFLGIDIRKDIDDTGKRIARRTRDILDTINLTVRNARSIEEQREAIDTILTSVGRLEDLETRFGIPGLRPLIGRTGLLGMDKPLANQMLEHLASQARLSGFVKGKNRAYKARRGRKRGKKRGPEELIEAEQVVPDEALAAMVKAYIDDFRIIKGDKFAANYGAIQETIFRKISAKVDEVPLAAMSGADALDFLKGTVISSIRENGLRAKVNDLTNVKVTKSIILGSMQEEFAKRVFHIVGPRFNASAARGMNYSMGAGKVAVDELLEEPLKVGDYVVFRSEQAAFQKLHLNRDNAAAIAGISVEGKQRIFSLEQEISQRLKSPSRRINKIDGDTVYLNTGESAPIGALAMRDVRLSILDTLDGFAAFGMQNLTSISRSNVLNEMGVARDTYARMVIHSVGPGDQLRMMPRALVQKFSDALNNIEKELDQAVSENLARGAWSEVSEVGGLLARGMLSWFKRYVLYGLFIPRPTYFTNQHAGEYAQMMDSVGGTKAAALSLQGSMQSLPVFGKSLQNAYFGMARQSDSGKILLPTAAGASFNTYIDKILRAGDEAIVVNGKKTTAGKFYGEAIEDGVGEFIMSKDLSKLVDDQVQYGLRTNQALVAKIFYSLDDYSRITELKVREVTRRQRLLFYSHLRINKGLSRDAAAKLMNEAMYDWTFSVSRAERKFMHDYVFFYTLVKNGFAQVFRMFMEGANVGMQEYVRRFARGRTKLQRLETLSRLMSAPIGFRDPYITLEPEEGEEAALEQEISLYLTDYGLVDAGTINIEGRLRMAREGYFARPNYLSVIPKLTTVEFAGMTANLANILSAIGIMGLNSALEAAGAPPTRFAVSKGKVADEALEFVEDALLHPAYGAIARSVYEGAIGRQVPRSDAGRMMRSGDRATMQTLIDWGVVDADTFIVTPSAFNPDLKRMKIDALPFVDELAFSIARTELTRFRGMAMMLFPEANIPGTDVPISPVEMKVLAEDDTGKLKLLGLRSTTGLFRVVFYNGELNRYYRFKGEDEEVARLLRQITKAE